MTITGRLVALAAVGLALAWVSAGLALAWALVLVLLAATDVALAARLAAVQCARAPSPAVRVGRPSPSVLTLTNTGRRRLRGQIRDAWVPSAGAAPRVQPVTVPARDGRASVTTTLTPTRRGERTAVEVTLRSSGPLGLAGRQRRRPVPGSVLVLPRFGSRRFLPEKLSRLRHVEGAVLVRQRGRGSEFDSLRGYVIGDDVRSIDWRASARSRDVVVRTWRPERDRHIVLALDTGRAAAARIGDEPRLDSALDACLLLTAVAARAGDRVALVAADVAVRAQLGLTGGHGALAKVVAALTPLQPNLVETDPHLLASEVLRRVGKRCLVVLFASLDTAADTALLPAARALAARHELIVASAGDPRLAELAAGRDGPADVYTAAAAQLATAARQSVVDELQAMGAHVVHAPADGFASHVTDAYLGLKAAGRL